MKLPKNMQGTGKVTCLYTSADDWANNEEEDMEDEEEDEDDEAGGDSEARKARPSADRIQKKAHMNIIFIGHVGKNYCVSSAFAVFCI